MNPVIVHLVQLPDAARETAQKAARANWPRAQFHIARTVAEAAAHAPAAGRQLLVLGGIDEAQAGLATQSLDAADLPRWAVVCLGRHTADLAETVAPEDWHVAPLTRIFRASLLQHELLRENLQLRGDLKTIARRVSHDARTPLGCIHTVCELLKDIPPADAAALRESTDVIRSSTAELSLLVDRVSFLIRATLDVPPPGAFPLGPTVEAALQQLHTVVAASPKKIRQPASWPEAEGVPAWTEAIWWNLIHNALHHGARTGTIQLGWAREAAGVRCWVASPGAVTEAAQSRLLKNFHLLHQNPTGGFGLAIVERLVALQGGTCGYETAEDNRAVFSFTLRAPARETAAGARQASLAGSGAT